MLKPCAAERMTYKVCVASDRTADKLERNVAWKLGHQAAERVGLRAAAQPWIKNRAPKMRPHRRKAQPVSYLIRDENETQAARHSAALMDLELLVILSPFGNLQPPRLLKNREGLLLYAVR
jgi:hypothetical protein